MDCTRYEEMMSAALDGELSAGERRELDRHMADCPACAALFNELREQCAALRELDCPFPDGLHKHILENLPEQEQALTRPPARRAVRWQRWGAMAACLVLVAAAVWALPMLSPRSGEPALAGMSGGQFESCEQNGDASVQRSAGEGPGEDVQPAPYAEVEDVVGSVHFQFENDQYIRVAYGYTAETGARIIGSVQSLDEYTAQFPFDGLSGLLSGYDETYFETGRLLAVVVEEASSSIRHLIPAQGLLRDQVTIIQTSPYGTEDMAAWLILAEVDPVFDDGDELAVTVIPCEEAEP